MANPKSRNDFRLLPQTAGRWLPNKDGSPLKASGRGASSRLLQRTGQAKLPPMAKRTTNGGQKPNTRSPLYKGGSTQWSKMSKEGPKQERKTYSRLDAYRKRVK